MADEHNGNGHVENNGETASTSPFEQAWIPGKNGGRLLAGGKRGNRGGGTTPKVIREGFRANLPATEERLAATVAEMAALVDRLKEEQPNEIGALIGALERLASARRNHADFLAKYGLGTTVTETDTDGNDAPRPQVIAYIPENGRTSRF